MKVSVFQVVLVHMLLMTAISVADGAESTKSSVAHWLLCQLSHWF